MSEIIYHIIIIATGVFSIVKGFRSGLLYQIPNLIGLAFGAVTARILSPDAEPLVREHLHFFDDPVTSDFIYCMLTTCLLYIAGYLVFRSITLILRGMFVRLQGGIVNDILGSAFAFFNNLMLLSVVFNLLLCFNMHSTLLKYSCQDDGNVVEVVMLLAPALTGALSCQDLGHYIQLHEAKKISVNNLPPGNVININPLFRPRSASDEFKYVLSGNA